MQVIKHIIIIHINLFNSQMKYFRNDSDKYFQFAIDPRMACKGFIENKCRILDSKKLPLWLRMKGYRDELTTNQQIKLI
mgnify:CR=1 FL=1|jgi:hypothetical protein